MLLNSALELHQTEVKNMANNKNHIKKRYYPLRDAENPYKVSLVEITEVQYRALYPEIWSTQNCEQYHHRCMCSKKYIWKCDGNCDLCEYHTTGETLSLDVPTKDGNANMYDATPDTAPTMEDVITDRILIEQLFAKLRELDPDADIIIQCWLNDYEISDHAIAEQLGRKQETFADQMKKIRTELRKIRGY